MRRQDAEVHKDRLQRDDQDHTYLVRERGDGEWEVVRIDLARRSSDLRAERGQPTNPPDDTRPFLIRQVPPYGPPLG
jgi:hypothetical protein